MVNALLAVVALGGVAVSAQLSCPASWTPYYDVAGAEGAHSCIKYFGEPKTWAAAHADCEAQSFPGVPAAHLLTVKVSRVRAVPWAGPAPPTPHPLVEP